MPAHLVQAHQAVDTIEVIVPMNLSTHAESPPMPGCDAFPAVESPDLVAGDPEQPRSGRHAPIDEGTSRQVRGGEDLGGEVRSGEVRSGGVRASAAQAVAHHRGCVTVIELAERVRIARRQPQQLDIVDFPRVVVHHLVHRPASPVVTAEAIGDGWEATCSLAGYVRA
jgi:hypothetical protein